MLNLFWLNHKDERILEQEAKEATAMAALGSV